MAIRFDSWGNLITDDITTLKDLGQDYAEILGCMADQYNKSWIEEFLRGFRIIDEDGDNVIDYEALGETLSTGREDPLGDLMDNGYIWYRNAPDADADFWSALLEMYFKRELETAQSMKRKPEIFSS